MITRTMLGMSRISEKIELMSFTYFNNNSWSKGEVMGEFLAILPIKIR